MIEKCAIILLLNILFFAKTLCFKYASDDVAVFLHPPKFNNFFDKLMCWLDGRYRSGMQVDHALTTLLHGTVAVLIYLAFGKSDASFIAAILFSLNPTNNQGSVWISGRSYVLAALGMTFALAFPKLCGVGLLLATYTNAGFIAPLVLLLSPLFTTVFLAVPFAWWMNWKRFRGNVKHKMDMEMIDEDKAIKPEKLVLVIKTFGFYTLLTLIPFKNTFYHSFVQSTSGSGVQKAYTINDRFFWIGLSFLGAMAWYMITHPWGMVHLALIWWCVCLAPFCNFMRMGQEIAERYTYLPSVGLMFVLATVLINYPVWIGVFIAMYAVRMWFLMDMYEDDYFLLEHSCLLDTSSWFAWHTRALKRWEQQSYREAAILWTMARRLSPREFKILYNLAVVCIFAGHQEESKIWIDEAAKHIPKGQEERSAHMIEQFKKGNYGIIG